MNPHQRCLQAKVENWNEPKQVMAKSKDLSRSLEIKPIWRYDMEFPTIFNKSCTYKYVYCYEVLDYGLKEKRDNVAVLPPGEFLVAHFFYLGM